jgi:hypothetical protein
MQFHPLQRLVAIAYVVALPACASKPVSLDKPVVRKIALIPATAPLRFTLENQNAVIFLSPITSVGFYQDSKA